MRVVYLARLRDAFGMRGETLALPGDDAPTVDSLVGVLARPRRRVGDRARAGARGALRRQSSLAQREQAVADGDEVAIFPPVTGG